MSIRPIPNKVSCVRCGADCTAAFAWEVNTATELVSAAWGNGLKESIDFLDDLERTIECAACLKMKK